VVRAQAPQKQAVVDTSAGIFVLDLDPAAAPNQAAYFMKLQRRARTTARHFIEP
jgi:hypothetical protein